MLCRKDIAACGSYVNIISISLSMVVSTVNLLTLLPEAPLPHKAVLAITTRLPVNIQMAKSIEVIWYEDIIP